MFRKWIFSFSVICLMSLTFESSACDVCGCAISGQQFGILPQFNKHFIGLKHSYRSFRSVHPPLFSTDKEIVSNEYFHNTEIYGRYVIGNRIQLFGFLPFQHITKKESDSEIVQKGLGDVSVIAMYSLINQKKSSDYPLYQNLQIGGGVKLPTGAHDFYTNDDEWIPGIQKGTGTTDLLINANYLVRYDGLGLSAECSFRINGSNDSQDFKYGNRFASSLRLFYLIDKPSHSFLPSIGLVAENASKDFHQGAEVDFSGGTTLLGQIGVDYFNPSYTVGFHIQPPIYQHVASGNLNSGTRVSAQVAVMF